MATTVAASVETLREMDKTPESLLPYIIDVVVGVYEGERSKDELPHGSGRCTFKNGSTYEGLWRDGYMHGQGTYVWVDGVQFKGDFHMNQIQGTGTFAWPNGDVYVGELRGGKRDGRGRMYLKAEGTCYDGEWLEGLKHGYGKLDYGMGKKYVGDWKEDLKDGNGMMTYKNGDVYNGQWSKGMKQGKGRMDYKETNSFYAGEWYADLPHGKGEQTWKDIGTKNPYLQTFNRYKGDFKEGMRDGQGTFFYATGASYKGDWSKNVKQGEGTFVYEDGTVYTGEFTQDRLPRRQNGDKGPGFSVRVDISDLIGESPDSKSNADLSNCILRFNSELRALYRKYSQVPVKSSKADDACSTSLLSEQIVELCKHHKLVNLDYQLCHARDVISAVCSKLLHTVDVHYFEDESASVLYKDLVEILVRIAFSKYHAIESLAQRFVTLVEQDILPKMGQDPQWHYLSEPSSNEEVFEVKNNHKDALKGLFDDLVGSNQTFEVNAKQLVKLLKAKGLLLVKPKPVVEEAAPEDETGGEEGAQAEEENVEAAKEENGEAKEENQEKAPETVEEEAPEQPVEGEDSDSAKEGEEAEAEAEEGKPSEEEGEEKCKLTLPLALKCFHVANFGSNQTREDIFESGSEEEVGFYQAAISMKYPEFVDSLMLCADLAFEDITFSEKFDKLMSAIIA
ncbi:hypothetical protein HOP50_17g79570 [Chloropicon primus]|uniref:Uncharacterized protein n=1 Tax=Chloropicon primus TaxID=1764295 RepID=A0A5B8MZC8_9CHLO|nr:hypothetical protein A3770_17p79340 [Chloropicon primus]UPR04613.1 hypothetical protein HOP50_17g79570 [Chloropicon primus]|eukprot:QDZ25416.1 hypothetical protein A3770_17p79340 [Chloropicon primus]